MAAVMPSLGTAAPRLFSGWRVAVSFSFIVFLSTADLGLDRGSFSPALESTAAGDALRVPAFWQLTGGLFNRGFAMSLLSSHDVPMLTDHGFRAMTATSAIGFLGIASMVGGMALGMISDRWGRKPALGSWLGGALRHHQRLWRRLRARLRAPARVRGPQHDDPRVRPAAPPCARSGAASGSGTGLLIP
jgi:hypothetical protein